MSNENRPISETVYVGLISYGCKMNESHADVPVCKQTNKKYNFFCC